MKSKQIIEQKYKKVSCPLCSSNNVIKRGIRKTEHRGKVQRFGCKDCGKRFSIDDGFWKMKNHEKKITQCIDLYYKGVSFRKLQEHLQAFSQKNAHYSTIYRWLIKYSMMVARLTDNLPIQCGNEMMSDEIEYYRRLYHQKGMKGREQNWFVDTFDLKTRFMITGEYMKSRTNENLEKVMRLSRYKTNGQIKI